MLPIIQTLWVVCNPIKLQHSVTTAGRWPATWTKRWRRPLQTFRHNKSKTLISEFNSCFFFTLLVNLQIFFINFKYFLQKKCNLDEKINPVGRRGGVHGWLDHQCRCHSAQVGQVAGRLQELGDGGVNRASFTQVELINDSLYKERGSLKPGKNVNSY